MSNGKGRENDGVVVMTRVEESYKNRLFAKRIIDVLLSVIALPAAVAIVPIVALFIKLDSKGPVLFAQKRIGRNGKPFTMYKFRSMYRDADKMVEGLGDMNEASGPVFKMKKDPRITKVGGVLRRTSIDEIPQIINVLKGEMSVVGPRPALPCEVEKYSDFERRRLEVKPGVTCLWQVQGRSNIPFKEWVKLDIEYIDNQSIWMDFKIILKTVPAVIKGSGAW